MKKQQVKHLEDEFTNLFNSNSNQQSSIEQSETYLLDSHQQPQQINSQTFKQLPYSQTESEDDFLDQVDEVLGHADETDEQPTRRQVMLNFKVNELKLICKNLKNANSRLVERMKEIEQGRPQLMSESQIEPSRFDLTIIQQDFVELEQELSSYKAQLVRYQKTMSEQLSQKQKQIDQLQNQNAEMRNICAQVQRIEQQINEKDRIISLLERRNQELLLEIQEGKEEWTQRDPRRRQNSFNEKISSEMQVMIDKLLKELKFQKKTSSKQLIQIKRLNSEIMDVQGILKQKNKKIYQLQFALLKANKAQMHKEPFPNQREKQRAQPKQEYSQSSSAYLTQDLGPYLPQRIQRGNHLMAPKKPQQDIPQSKNRSIQNNRSYERNRMSAERENGVVRGGLGLLTKCLSFTLMDLLNRQFKIRQAEKQIIACRIIDLYSRKIIQGNYENLIPEEIEIYNFSSQSPLQIKVRANLMMNKGDRDQATERALLYNMSFILDTLLNQVEVVDAFVQNSLNLNIGDFVSQVEVMPSKQEKYKSLQELANNIQAYYIPH